MVGKDTFLGWGGLPALLACWAIVVLYLLVRRRRLTAQPDRERLRRWGLAITLVNLSAVAALCAFGPSVIVTNQELSRRLPIYLGLTGYRLVLQPIPAGPAVGIGARIGPEPLVWPPAAGHGGTPYYLVVPGLTVEDESGRAPNGPSSLQVRCDRAAADARCTVTVAAGERRRDYLPAIERDGRWQWVGTQPIPSGQSITIEPAAVKGPRYGARTLTVRYDGGDVLIDGCRVHAPAAGEAILPLVDLYFFDTAAGCVPRELAPEDSEKGLWLRPAADGGTEIPAYSFLAVRAGPAVDLVTLDDRAFVVTGPGAAAPGGQPLTVSVGAQETVRVAVLRRRFQERAVPTTCSGSADLLGCLRLTGTLEPLAWTVRVDLGARQATLAIDIDRASPLWRPLAWSAFTPDRLELDGQPIRFSFEQGRWRAGEPRPRSSHEQPLELPFRLLGGLPYSAQFLPRLEGIDRASLVVHDSARRPRVFAAGDRFELGPPEARAVVEVERAGSSKRLARAALAPLVALALGILLFQLLAGGSERLQAAALLAGCAVVAVTYGQLLRAHAGYALVVHEPWDHAAFQQIVESSIGVSAALAIALLLALAWPSLARPPMLRRLAPEARAFAVAALVLGIAVVRGLLSLTGNERLGAFRLVLLGPILAALVWRLVSHASVDAEAGRAWRWSCERLGLRRLPLPGDEPNAGRWRAFCLVVATLSVAAWFRDLGALLLVLVPVSLAFVLLWGPRARPARAAVLAAAGGLVALGLTFPGLFGQVVLALKKISEIPALAVGHQGACGTLAAGENRCGLQQADRSSAGDSKALDLLERAELTLEGRPSSRRHALRLLDWYEDGRDSSSCFAAERFATNEALEVAFFRAQVRHYRAAREQLYLRDGLLPFAPAVQRAFVADYLGAVAFAPQLPRGSLVGTALALLAVLAAAVLIFPAGWQARAGAAGFGALVFLTCASVLTVAANLDLLPNFAQNLPLVAVRSGSAWAIDALALGLALLLLAAPPEEERP
jgi:hypothetical protein